MADVDPRTSNASLDERVTALEARVAAIEARPHTGPEVAGVVDADTFWALEGLAARVPEPGAVMIVGDVVTPGGQVARWQQGAETADLLDDEWDRVADVLAALGHPVRLELLRHVLRDVTSARELTELDAMGTSGQVYHHLRQLTAAGWLRRRGARYEVPPEAVVPLLATVLGGRR